MWKHIKRILDIPVYLVGEILRYYLVVRGTEEDVSAKYRTKLLDRLEASIPYIALWIVLQVTIVGVWINNHLDCCL